MTVGSYAILKRQMFKNLRFLKSKFSYLTIGEYLKVRCVKILDFEIQVFIYLTIGENRKVRFMKVGEII